MSECIEWAGARNRQGYGITYKDGKGRRAHRVAWEEANGPIPEGLFVCHSCDNPPCVNSEHLFLGTPNDNVQDMLRKGRARLVGVPRKEVCVAGHPLSGDNLITTKRKRGGEMRSCRECGRRRAREHYRKKNNLDVKPIKED